MVATIPNLWADDINVDVQTPLAILRVQESQIAQKTKGILQGQVTTTVAGDWIHHQLDLVAPALKNYRITLLRASHHKDAVYPVYVISMRVSPKRETVGGLATAMLAMPVGALLAQREVPEGTPAHSQDEFIELVRKVLQSGDVRALIDSLIARSNEIRSGDQMNGEPASTENGDSK